MNISEQLPSGRHTAWEFSSVQSQIISTRSGKLVYAFHVCPAIPRYRPRYWSDWRWFFDGLSWQIVHRFLSPRISPPGSWWCEVLGFEPSYSVWNSSTLEIETQATCDGCYRWHFVNYFTNHLAPLICVARRFRLSNGQSVYCSKPTDSIVFVGKIPIFITFYNLLFTVCFKCCGFVSSRKRIPGFQRLSALSALYWNQIFIASKESSITESRDFVTKHADRK